MKRYATYLIYLSVALYSFSCQMEFLNGVKVKLNHINDTLRLDFVGQSNMRGLGDSAYSHFPIQRSVQNISGQYILIKDPVGISNSNFQKALTGSLLPAFAYEIERLGFTLIAMHRTKNGAGLFPEYQSVTITNMLPIIISHSRMQDSICSIKSSGMVWLQGEADGNLIHSRTITEQQHLDRLDSVFNVIRDSLNYQIFVINIGHGGEKDSAWRKVRENYRKIDNRYEWVHIVNEESVNFLDNGMTTDGVHYTQGGYNLIGKESARAILEILLLQKST